MNKASEGDRIPVELFQILKDDAEKVLHSVCQQIWKTQQRPQDWKRSVFIPIPKKGNAKECSNYCTIALISHITAQSNAQSSPCQASIVCERRTPRCSSWIQKRQRNQRSNCQHLLDHQKSKRTSEKHLLIGYAKIFDCVEPNKLKNSQSDGNTRPPYLSPEKSVCRSRSNGQNLTQNTGLVLNQERST